MPSSVFRRVADIWKNLPWANSLKMIFESRWWGKCSGGVPFCLGPDFNNNQASLSHTLFAWRVSLLILLYRLTGAYKESQLERGCQGGSLHRNGTLAKGKEETGQMKSTVVSSNYAEKKKYINIVYKY